MSIRFPSMLSGAALFGVLLTMSPLHADEWNKKTTITINEAVQMPSCCTADHTVTLQPGKYVMVLVDSQSDRHIVRVFQQDGKSVVTTILAIPNYRLKPTGKSSFQFWETPAGQPRAMRAWFYPGDNFGQEFVYNKTRAVEIAATSKSQVATAVTTQESELNTAAITNTDEKGVETVREVEAAPPVVVAETKVETPVSQPEPVAAPAQEVSSAPESLPHTSSPFPLVGLIGLGSLAFSGLMSRFSKRG